MSRVCAAPSPVSVVRKGVTGKSSIAISWAKPDRPNGIILEYEIKYFEKVNDSLLLICSYKKLLWSKAHVHAHILKSLGFVCTLKLSLFNIQ